jgi:hypothetical protein
MGMSEEEIIKNLKELISWKGKNVEIRDYEIDAIKDLLDLYNKEKEKNEKLETNIQNGTISDGFHSFNDLYYQRCILFATICKLNKNIAWKSKRHNDGKKCFDSDDWFIVGVDTPQGSYTYHYESKYWDLFDIQELDKGKKWDGHTEKDVIRLFSLVGNYISKDKIKEKFNKVKEKCEVELVYQIIDLLEKEILGDNK